ncbi:MAG: hypothetical protein HND57_04200 [Planctomycetes bacterium]|nr:hypothetical protein [Planctomycetota bacterium]
MNTVAPNNSSMEALHGRLRPLATVAALCCAGATALLATTTTSSAVEIQDIIRIKGHEANHVRGIGLVTGLDGTGGSTKKSERLKRPLLVMYQEAGFGTQLLDELTGIDTVAAVELWCEVPGTGAREGDRFDVHVTVVGDASSLEGGMLIQTPLKPGRGINPYAVASGPIEIVGTNKRHGIIRGGAQMLQDIRTTAITQGADTVTLVLDTPYAEYPIASTIASHITQEFMIDATTIGNVWAEVEDNKNVVVHLSSWQTEDPASLLGRILTLDIDASLLQVPARVLINKEAGTILVTGNVEISAIVITSRGLTITRIVPEPVATPANPVYETSDHVAVSSTASVTPNATARLDDLLQALESLKVPFDERVTILREMKKMGVLHAQLIES